MILFVIVVPDCHFRCAFDGVAVVNEVFVFFVHTVVVVGVVVASSIVGVPRLDVVVFIDVFVAVVDVTGTVIVVGVMVVFVVGDFIAIVIVAVFDLLVSTFTVNDRHCSVRVCRWLVFANFRDK